MFIQVFTISIILFGFAFLLLVVGLILNKDKGMKGHSCGVSNDDGACSMCGLKDISTCDEG